MAIWRDRRVRIRQQRRDGHDTHSAADARHSGRYRHRYYAQRHYHSGTDARTASFHLLDEDSRIKRRSLAFSRSHAMPPFRWRRGHLGIDEVLAVCSAANKIGTRIILTHPDWKYTIVPLDLQVSLARNGVVSKKSRRIMKTALFPSFE